MKLPSLKLILLRASFLTLMLAMPGALRGQTNWADIFRWQVLNDRIYIEKYLANLPPLHEVTIPDTINGLPVVGLSLEAFYNCTNLSAVTFADNITYIGDYVFSRCSNLSNLMIPDIVNTIGNSAFESCVSLTNVTLGTNVGTIGGAAFRNCYNLTSVTIPSSVTSLSDLAFDCGTQLTRAYFEGNAPGVDVLDGSRVFGGIGYTNTAIYYLPGTTGWANAFPGLPTVPWQPLVQTRDASFGIGSNQFGFNISWARGRTVVVEATTNTTAPTWVPVGTNTLYGGPSYFGDLEWTNYPARFYRVRFP